MRIMCTTLIYFNVSSYTEKSYLNMYVSRDYGEVTVFSFFYVKSRGRPSHGRAALCHMQTHVMELNLMNS